MREKIKPITTSTDRRFHDGDPVTGELGTLVTADWLNGVQDGLTDVQSEVTEVIKSAGIEPDSGNSKQLVNAIDKKIGEAKIVLPDGTTAQQGIVQLLTSFTSESETMAATPKSLKLMMENIKNLPLKGDPGLQGERGLQGPKGDPGPMGPRGYGNANYASKNSNGYWICGDTGVIFQWGSGIGAAAGRYLSYNFPITYPTKCFVSVASIDGQSTWPGNYTFYVRLADNRKFYIMSNGIGTNNIFWFSIGH